MHWSYLKMSHRCLIEDGLQMPYQKMCCRSLMGDDLQMSYQKMSCMRCLKDILYNLTVLYIIYLCFIYNFISDTLNLIWKHLLSNLVLSSYNTNTAFSNLPSILHHGFELPYNFVIFSHNSHMWHFQGETREKISW